MSTTTLDPFRPLPAHLAIKTAKQFRDGLRDARRRAKSAHLKQMKMLSK